MGSVLDAKKAYINNSHIAVEQIITPVALPQKLHALEFILGELLDNAIQATVKDGARRIYIKAEVNLGWVEIQVANTGPKIKEEEVAVMFDPFVTTGEFSKSKGLGLSLVLAIVGRLKGKLSYVRDDEYTIFTVYLPIVGQDVSEDVA